MGVVRCGRVAAGSLEHWAHRRLLPPEQRTQNRRHAGKRPKQRHGNGSRALLPPPDSELGRCGRTSARGKSLPPSRTSCRTSTPGRTAQQGEGAAVMRSSRCTEDGGGDALRWGAAADGQLSGAVRRSAPTRPPHGAGPLCPAAACLGAAAAHAASMAAPASASTVAAANRIQTEPGNRF